VSSIVPGLNGLVNPFPRCLRRLPAVCVAMAAETEYTSLALFEPDTTDHNSVLPETSSITTTAIAGISFRRRGNDYSPTGDSPGDTNHHPTIRTGTVVTLFFLDHFRKDSSFGSSYLDESNVSTPQRLIPTPHSFKASSFSRESRDSREVDS
jgi:hypothetical protein